ncbi:MAG TPA: bifunctional diaminohydroxyphosphoribosylaminopyrimidine deaminase/5-amino-6-(5-phosphoribosylamino)uracil reductase RibD [Clostridia bacterium]|nr:bifunctional diaminohydroxyphosphoribosylaminopyrimidine deaminase/5-amino-6-(5-phosphoribosylamino)uracil reductase RibD [Clostridia bacterium]
MVLDDSFYMKKVLELAARGSGSTSPNPLVGAVIVKEGRVIGEGWHERAGEAHAEINAIRNSSEDVENSTIYVNLEPCSHFGRTPPCAAELVKRRFKRVVVAMEDPNPLVAGRGIKLLKDSGIQVDVGINRLEALKLNDIFIKFITKKTPFVLLKSAMTLDGKTATKSGDSKWISGEQSREYVHNLRNKYSSILVGVNTAIKDDPELTTRLEGIKTRNPVRIIVDSKGRIPADAKVLETDENKRTIIAATGDMTEEKLKYLKGRGIEVIITDKKDGKVDIRQLMEELYKRGIDSLMVEGGGTVASAFIEEGLIDKVAFFIAPVIIGGKAAPTPVMGAGVDSISDGYRLKHQNVTTFGHDVLIEGYVNVPWEE